MQACSNREALRSAWQAVASTMCLRWLAVYSAANSSTSKHRVELAGITGG